ncbi:MAG: DUF1080 domain-containing protein [Anaerolineales bacterium]|nr:DUF1080 domain-containing protein [Anaerolineales bacterium]
MKKRFPIHLLVLLILLVPAACTFPQNTTQPTASQLPAQATVELTATDRPAETPLPTLTPTTTPTLKPAERYFNEPFEAGIQHWSQIQFFGNETGANITVRDGVLAFELGSELTWAYLLYQAFTYEDVRLEISVVNRASEQNSIGLVCRYSETQGWYEFNVSNDGIYNILYGQKLADGISQYNPIVTGAAQKIKPGTEPNQYTLVCQEKVITILINGVQIRSIKEERYNLEGGQAGITVSSFQSLPVIAEVDWVEISAP